MHISRQSQRWWLVAVGDSLVRRRMERQPKARVGVVKAAAPRAAMRLAELQRVLKVERGCRTQLESLHARPSGPQAISQADVDLLRAVQHNQREAEQALTGQNDGLPSQIRALLADLETNRLPAADLERRMAALADEIGHLAREHLPAIGRELDAGVKSAQVAREEQGRAEQLRERLTASLTVAGTHLDAVIAALEQMIGRLSQWDSYQQFLRQVGQLLRGCRPHPEMLQAQQKFDGLRRHPLFAAVVASFRRASA